MIYGIDIGATYIKIGLFNKGELIEKWKIDTDLSDNGKNILKDIALFINEKDINVEGYGFGIPGNVISDVVLTCPNIKWENVNVKKEFLELVNNSGVVAVNNDANVAVLAEFKHGEGQGYKNIVMLTIGSGIGGGIIIDGNLYNGKDGMAGELGHIKVEFDKPRLCGCGKYGCLEAMASAKHFKKSVIENMPKDHYLYNKDFNSQDIFDNDNDDYLAEKRSQLAKHLAIGIANITCILNPDIVLIGGGMSNTGDFLIKIIKEKYKLYCYAGLENQKIKIAKLKNDAGIIGAMEIVLDKINKK